MNASSISAFATRAAVRRASVFAAVLTMGATSYDCVIDPGQLSQALGTGGMDRDQELQVVVANSESIGAAADILGRSVTITSTATDKLEGLTFVIRGVTEHPVNPETILTLEVKR